MSNIQDRKCYLQLWTFTTGPAIDVMHLYFEVKILNNTNLQNFLNDQNNMHQLFHQCFPTTPCCKCSTASLASAKKRGCLSQKQFDKLYDNSCLPQPRHEILHGNKITQHCLCKYSAKCSVAVDDLDITLFYDIIQYCCPSRMNFTWRKGIKDVRNFLAHVGNGEVKKADFDDNWKILKSATLGFACEIGNKCQRMFLKDILQIENSSIEALTEMVKKSNDDLIKKLDVLIGFKPLQTEVEECKKTVELVHNNQNDQTYKLQSSLDKSDEILIQTKENKVELLKITSDIKEVQHTVDNFVSLIKVDKLDSIISIALEKAMEKKQEDRKITVATQVDSSCWNEEKTIRNISNIVNTEIDQRSVDIEKFHIKCVEHKCIQLELVAFPGVFKTPQTLRKAVKSLVHQLVEAGEIDTKIQGKLEINLTVKTPLTREEIYVVHAVFDKHETFEESAGTRIDVKPHLNDGIPLIQTFKIYSDSLDKSDFQSDRADTANSTIIQKVQMKKTDEEKYEEIFVDVDNLKCLLKLSGLPNDLVHTELEERSPDVKGNQLLYVEWTMECPVKWNVALISSIINDNLSTFHDEISVDFVYSETSSKLIIHTTTQRCVFRSYSSLEVAVKNLIGKLVNVSSIKSTEPEELSVSVLIMTKHEEKEFLEAEFSKEVNSDQSRFGLKDNIVTCEHCTKGFSCTKCTSKINHIRRLEQALKMKDQTIQRLERALTKREKEMIEEDAFDYDSYYAVEKKSIYEGTEKNKRMQLKTAEIEISEEPEQKKRKTAITSDIEQSEVSLFTMTSSTPVCCVCDLRSITKPSIIWCFECDEGLCAECMDHHSLSKGTRKHCTVPMCEYQKIPYDIVKITQTCDKHDEKYTFYCKKHECLCCGSCIVENHLECRDFDKLTDVIQNTKLSNAFYEIEQSLVELSDNIQIIRNDREHNLKRLSEKKMQIEQEVKQTRITINNHLDNIQDDIIKKLNATEVKESKLISELLDLLKENESEIIEFRTNIENIKHHATDLQTFMSMKELANKIVSKDKFLQSVIDSKNFKDRELIYNANAAMQDLAKRITNFGEVKIKTKPCDVVLTRRKENQAQIMLPRISSKSVDNINLKLHKTINTIAEHIIGSCLLPDGKMSFLSYMYNGSAVGVFNFNGTKDFEVITPTLAFDIAYISHDNTLAVTSGNSGTKCITIIDIQNKQIKKTIPVDDFYFGIKVKNNKFICSAAGKGIKLINPHNNSTRDIVRDEIPECCYVAIFGDKIYHTNNKLNTVTCYDLQGAVKWKFKNESVLTNPSGISLDNIGNVYVVGNTSNNVVVISADGQQHKEILTARDGLSCHCSLDYNRITNQLLVANSSDKAMIFILT